MSLVDRQINWPAQDKNCDYFYEDQGGDATQNHTPARRRRHRYAQSGNFGQAMSHLAGCIYRAARDFCFVTETKVARIFPWKLFKKDLSHLRGDRQPFEAHPDSVTGDIRTVRSPETAEYPSASSGLFKTVILCQTCAKSPV